MPRVDELAARREALVARSALLRTALTLEVRLLDAQVAAQGARALQWWRVAQTGLRVLRLSTWAVPMVQALRAGRGGGSASRRLLRGLARLLPLALRALPGLLRRTQRDATP